MKGIVNSVTVSLAIILCIFSGAAAQHAKIKPAQKLESELREKTSSLDSLKTELEKGRQKLSELEKQEGDYTDRLSQIEENITHAEAYITGLSGQIGLKTGELARLEDSLQSALERLRLRQEVMKKRLRLMYKSPNPTLAEIVLTSKSMTEILGRVRYYRDLFRYDTVLIHSIDSCRATVELQKKTAGLQREKLVSLREEKENQQNRLIVEKESRTGMIREVQAEKKKYLAMISEMEDAQKELSALIKELKKTRVKTRKPGRKEVTVTADRRKGKLPWPVRGEVVREFGKIVHPVYKTVTVNNGIDINTQADEKVVCVAPGTVIYIGKMRGLGQFIVVDHANDLMSIYAHVDGVAVKQEQSVTAGTMLGHTADSGTGGGSQLHFEIRKASEAVDPRDWLE